MRRTSATACFLASFVFLGVILSWAPRAIAQMSSADIADTGPTPCPSPKPKPAPAPTPTPTTPSTPKPPHY